MSERDDEKLVEAVKALVEPEDYRNVLEGGCQSGAVAGLIYYHETVKFHDEHELAIWDLVYRQMQEYGETTKVLEFIASWRGAKDVSSMTDLKNLLAWYACEHIVCRLNDAQEDK